MQRQAIAVGLLLFGVVAVAKADYVVIRVILANQGGGDQANPNGPMGGFNNGQEGGFSPMVGGGGALGIMGGGNRGIMGGGGALGIMGGGGALGIMGGGNRGIMGGGGALGIMGGGGQLGIMGGAGNRGTGPMGAGIMGANGNQGNQGNQGAQGGGRQGETITKIKFDPKTMMMVVIDLQDKPELRPLGGQSYPFIEHKWNGTTYVHNDDFILVDVLKKPSISTQYASLEKKMYANRTPAEMLKLAVWSLERGLVPETMKMLDLLVTAFDKDKTKFDAKQTEIVEAYRKAKAEILDQGIGLNVDDNSDQWKANLGYQWVARSDHYALVHNADNNRAASVERRLDQLERNYKAIVLWDVLRGKVLPVPKTRMVVVLADQASDLTALKEVFQPDAELVTDGVLSPRHNVAFLCATRADNTFLTFTQLTRAIENSGWSTAELLKGQVPRKKGTEPTKADEAARAQTLVLVERALIEESELSAVSRVGTRQLLTASGMMPRNVHAPEWFDFGFPSFFETAKGPFSYETSQVKVAFWQGYGVPSWAYMELYRELVLDKKIEKSKSVELLKDVLTDEGFMKARKPMPIGTPPELVEKFNDGQHKELERARMFSWSFCYFLLKKQPELLAKFIAEMDRLPRELDFSAEEKLAVAGRAFGFYENGTINNAKLKALANEWLLYMDTQSSPVLDIKLEDPKPAPSNNLNGGLGNPMGPIGSPMGPMGGGLIGGGR